MFLELCKPFLPFLPEVSRPHKIVPFKEKLMWTVVSVFVFLVCCQIPLFGSRQAHSADPFYWMRVILASNRGTLMELGISPIITASMLLEVLVGIKVLDVDTTKPEQRHVFEGAQKLMSLLLTAIQAVAYVASGMYGEIGTIGIVTASAIVLQLIFATLLCILLDELLSKGWGLVSGISLFIAVNICESILWKAFSPTTYNTGRGTEFEGALIAFVYLIITRSDKLRAFKEAFHRPHLPNVTNLLATLAVFVVVIFLQGFRVQLKLRPGAHRETTHDIKLFYTSNTPLILQTSLIANLKFFSQLLYRRFSGNVFVNLLGKWEARDFSQTENMIPIGGLAKYITAPQSFAEMMADPFHAIFYITFVLSTCALLSKIWIDINHSTGKDVAKHLISQGKYLQQARENEHDMATLLNRYIPTAAAFGGLCVGALTLGADFLGAIGSGTGILLAVSTIFQYYESIPMEEMPAFLRKLRGTK